MASAPLPRPLPVLRGALLFATAAVALVALAGPARAHGVFIGQSDIRQDGAVVRYDLAVHYDELAKRVGFGEAVAFGAPSRAVSDAEREATLRDDAGAILVLVSAHVRVLADGVPCGPRIETSEVVHHRGEVFAVLDLAYDCATASAARWEVTYDLFFDPLARAERAAHASRTTYDLGGDTGRLVLEPGAGRLAVGAAPVARIAAGALGDTVGRPLPAAGLLLALALLLAGARDRRRRTTAAAAFAAAVVTALVAASGAAIDLPARTAAGLLAAVALAGVTLAVRVSGASRAAAVGASGLVAGLALAADLSGGLEGVATWRRLAVAGGAGVGVVVAVVAVTVLGGPLVDAARRRVGRRAERLGAAG